MRTAWKKIEGYENEIWLNLHPHMFRCSVMDWRYTYSWGSSYSNYCQEIRA